MPPPPFNIKLQLRNTIKKFKFIELETIVLPQFPETSWDEIRYKLIADHQTFTTTNAIKMIEKVINEHNISETVLRDRLALMEVIEASRHPNRRIWYGYELKKRKNNTVFTFTIQEMRDCIIRNFNLLQLNMDVKMVVHDGLTYASIKEKKASRRLLPVFMAFYFDQGYFFCAKKSITKEFLHVITDSSGFTSCKKLSLVGRDIKSLIKLLQLKKQGVTTSNGLGNQPQYQEADAIVKNTGIDFRQHNQRKQHLKQCFGSEPPVIEALVLNKYNTQWADNDISDKLSAIELNMQWEFRSHNVPNFLIQLTEKRILTNPLPNYISNFLSSGKNALILRTDNR